MKPGREWLPENATLAESAKRLVDLRVNALPVCTSDGRLKGLLTNRRIVRALARNSNPAAEVGDMASPAVAVGVDDSLERALAIMKGQKLSSLPVTNGVELVGSVSKADIRNLLRLDAETAGPLVLDVAPAELAYQGFSNYLADAVSALRCVKLAMHVSGKRSVGRILDFACGRGRVMRLFKATFPEAELVACDVNPKAVDFCASAFGATPVYSSADPKEISIEGEFDLIWSGSLLTHLDAPRWTGFIELFRSLLRSDGLMLFTTHGRAVANRLESKLHVYGLSDERVEQLLRDYRSSGFGYTDYESDRGYGISLSSPAWVCALLEEIEGLRLGLYLEQGWSEHHDVVACFPA